MSKEYYMRIACLGWGSLVWRENEYPYVAANLWNTNGPLLPIEFARISQKSKLVTLVTDYSAVPINVLWCLVGSDINNEIKLLAAREGSPESRISFVTIKDNAVDPLQRIIQEWLIQNKLDAAIWTGLPPRNKNGIEIAPSLEEVIGYISELSDERISEAKKYILSAPVQINTKYRNFIIQHFGWD